MSREVRIACGVPENECTGSLMQTSQKHQGSKKGHPDGHAARRCFVNYMIRVKGYKRGNKSNELIPPNPDDPVMVLTRVSRFGAKFRKGKERRMMNERTSGRIIG